MTRDDLARANAIALVNTLRGWLTVTPDPLDRTRSVGRLITRCAGQAFFLLNCLELRVPVRSKNVLFATLAKLIPSMA